MTTTAKIGSGMPGGPVRRPAPHGPTSAKRPSSAPSHGARHPRGEVTDAQLVARIVQGSLVVCAVLVAVAGLYWLVGINYQPRFAPTPVGAGGSTTSPGTATVFYRDRGDGTVMVMEIDGGTTRIRGVMRREDVPMLQEEHHATKRWDMEGSSAQSRINALGSAFR